MTGAKHHAIEVTELSKRYKTVTAISNVSFTVASGECLGLVGPNGAGKTSLLSCLAGLRLPTAGTARVLGSDPAKPGANGQRIAHVFHPPSLSADFTAANCIKWEALAQGLSKTAAEEAIEQYGISSFERRRVGQMSTGQRQRVAIAASLLGDPDVLILDEPTNGLDVEAARWLRALLQERSEAARTTIISSHQLNEVKRIVDRVIVLDETLRYDGPLPDLNDDQLDNWYLTATGRKDEGAL